MAASLSQKEYLKRYMSGGGEKKKKKKKDKKKESKGMRIIEDTLSLNSVPYGRIVENDEDAPTVAEITYEDEKQKAMEEFRKCTKWKIIDGNTSKKESSSEEVGIIPFRYDSEYSLLRRKRHDSDTSAPRRRHDSDSSSPHFKDYDSDNSPPRMKKYEMSAFPQKKNADSDDSPPRRKRHDSDDSPPRRKRHDSDDSPARRKRHDSGDSPPRRKRHNSDDSPPRRKRHNSDDSPPRRKRHDSDDSPPIRKRQDSGDLSGMQKDYDSESSLVDRKSQDFDDLFRCKQEVDELPSETLEGSQKIKDSAKRSRQKGKELDSAEHLVKTKGHDSDTTGRKGQDSDECHYSKMKQNSIESPMRGKGYDSDESPHLKKEHDFDESAMRKRHDSDESPPRRKRHDSDESPPRRKRLDSDESPPRRKTHDSDESPPRKKREFSTVGKGQTMDGVSLPSAKAKVRRPEQDMTTQEYLLARKRGKLKKESKEDLEKKKREDLLQEKAKEKHQQWNKGVKQLEQQKQQLTSAIHEMSKSFARHADDKDLNAHQKEVMREDDPMLEYVMKQKAKATKHIVYPIYKGSFPPNRFNIRPGYRWDGVDRSTGFENQWYQNKCNQKAHDDDAYKWSTSDM